MSCKGGGFRWARRGGGGHEGKVDALAAGANGQVYVGPLPRQQRSWRRPRAARGLTDVILASYDRAEGAHRRSSSLGGSIHLPGTRP